MEIKKPVTEEMYELLYDAIVSIKDKDELKALLEDMCTLNEVESMAQRLSAAKLLMEGNTYTQVIDSMDISSATLSRVSRCVKYGKGYTSVLKDFIDDNDK